MKSILVTLCLAGITGSAAAAHAAGPAWCKDANYRGSPSLSGLQSTDPRTVLTTIAEAICNPDKEAETNRAQIEAARVAWGKKLFMSDADWADVVDYDCNSGISASLPEFSSKDLSKFSPIDQYIALRNGFTQPNGGGWWRDFAYNADILEQRLTHTGRYGYVKSCMNSSKPADWAICAPDLAKLDTNKILAEVTADKSHTGIVKMQLRLELLELKAELAAHDAKVKAALKSDAAYAKMFEIAAKARNEWQQMMGNEGALLEDVFKTESGFLSRSRSLQAGCEAKTATMLAAQVSKLPAKLFEGMIDKRWDPQLGFGAQAGAVLVDNPLVNLAATAYALCNNDGISTYLAAYLQEIPGYRGPRSLAHTRLLSEKFQLDDTEARVDWPTMDRPYARSHGAIFSSGGVIDKVTPSDKTVTVTFQKMMVKVKECVQSHTTRKIYKIHSDGRIEYESICDKTAMVTHNEQWSDFKVNKKFAALLKKGVKISVIHPGNSADGDTGMEVIAVWPNGKAATPSIVLGGQVK